MPSVPRHGLARFAAAFRYSIAGLRHVFRHEAAVREELVALVVLIPVSVALPVTAVEHLLLVCSMLLVLLVELLNTAVEATVDRISEERHPLSGLAKDLGSAAVLIALLMSALCWLVIAGPVALRWARR